MTKRCPTCGEPLPDSGQCDACRLVSEVLLTGDDRPPPAKDLPENDEWGLSAREVSPTTMDLLNEKFPPPATELPSPLPRPLDDPLRALSWYVLGFLVLQVAACALLLLRGHQGPEEEEPAFLSKLVLALAVAWFLFSVWRVLPHRRTNVLYLRSFRHDENTAHVPLDLIRAFRPGFRISR